MKNRSLCLLLCTAAVCASLTATLSAQGKKGLPPGTTDAYSISATALKGPNSADVFVHLKTKDPDGFPVPSIIKKIQVKVLDADSNIFYIHNSMDVPVEQGGCSMSLTGLEAFMPVLVQAHVKTAQTVDEEVLTASATVRLRPDLVVDTVRAPGSVRPGELFDVEVVLAEMLGQTDDTSQVSLFDGETLLGTATGIHVRAGERVSLFFRQLRLAELGMHEMAVRIHDADPAEYDTTNNNASFSVNVVNPLTSSSYSMSYSSRKEHTRLAYIGGCFGYSLETTHDNYDEFRYTATLGPSSAFASPIDSISFEITSGNGTVLNCTLSNPAVTSTGLASGSASEEYLFTLQDPGQPSFDVTLRVNHDAGDAVLQINKLAQDYYYSYSASWATTTVTETHDQMLNFSDSVQVRIALYDGSYAGGGGAALQLRPYVYHYDSTSRNSYCLGVTNVEHYYISTSEGSGLTDPSMVPGVNPGLQAQSQVIAVATADLAQNYPNPFNPSTIVEFTPTESGHAILMIYDLVGRQVAELFHGETVKGVTYKFSFDASNLPSGMYYARLLVGQKIFMRKMVLMK